MKKQLIFIFLLFSGFVFQSCKSPASSKLLPTVLHFSAIPSEIDMGESTELDWNSMNATSASIDNGVGVVATSGSITVSPLTTITYTLTLRNSDGSTTSSTTVTVKEVAQMILDGEPVKKMKSYRCPYFEGWVRNIGTVTGYNVMIQFRAYSDIGRTRIIDTASGFPADLGNIDPGQRAKFEAIFFNLSRWDQIKAWDYEISWLNINAFGQMQRIKIEGWGQ